MTTVQLRPATQRRVLSLYCLSLIVVTFGNVSALLFPTVLFYFVFLSIMEVLIDHMLLICSRINPLLV